MDQNQTNGPGLTRRGLLAAAAASAGAPGVALGAAPATAAGLPTRAWKAYGDPGPMRSQLHLGQRRLPVVIRNGTA